MAVYGVNVFGTARFGIDPNLARPDFSVAPFASTPLDYGTLHLTWSKPQSTDCTILQLVRNGYNLPQDEVDGGLIFNQPVGQANSYSDATARPGFNYYTMWGWDSVNLVWVRCTDLIALLPLNWGYGYRLYNLLPGAYRDADSVLVDPYNPWSLNGDGVGQPPLQRFLAMLGFELDFIRSELESLTSLNDPMNCSGALLPLLAFQLGLPNEPEIGMQQERQLIANAIHLYKLKGSPRGITEFTSIMTSYPLAQLVHHGYNLMLTRDDSVMDSSIGTWQPWPPPSSDAGVKRFATPTGTNSGLTLTQVPNLVPTCGDPTSLIGFEPPAGGGPPPYNNTGMRAQVTLSSVIDITTGPIPVLDFLSGIDGPGTITFQVQVWSTAARAVELSVWGDAGNGTPISLGPVSTVTNIVQGWKTFTFTAPVNPYTVTYNPDQSQTITTAYYWLYPRLRIISAAGGEAHYVTLGAVWPCPPAKAPAYDYPRDTKVILAPQATNLLSNPLTSFAIGGGGSTTQIGFDGWSAALDPTNAKTSPQSTPIYIHYGSPEDPPGLFSVFGMNSLQVSPVDQRAVVWAGYVDSFTLPSPPLPAGWFADPDGAWFGGAVLGPSALRPWIDPVLNWFAIQDDYFFVFSTSVLTGGDWFTQPQPPLTNNIIGYTAVPNQSLSFSIHARYMTVPDPSMAQAQVGLRWYFPDGTYYEDSDTFTLTGEFARLQFPPDNSPRSETPVQPVGNVPATTVYPFVRFPQAGPGSNFLLNAAMLSPGAAMPAFMDFSTYAGNPDYVQDSHGATYFYRGLNPRSARLRAEMYRFVPMGSSYTVGYGSSNTQLPLDPTLW